MYGIINQGGGEMLTKKELAAHLKVTERTVDRYRDQGMPYFKTITGLIRFNLDDVMKWLVPEEGE